VNSNTTVLLSNRKYFNEAGMNGKMNESVFMIKWIRSPWARARTICGGRTLLEIRTANNSSELKVILAIVSLSTHDSLRAPDVAFEYSVNHFRQLSQAESTGKLEPEIEPS
jgi:hypothetical protein